MVDVTIANLKSFIEKRLALDGDIVGGIKLERDKGIK